MRLPAFLLVAATTAFAGAETDPRFDLEDVSFTATCDESTQYYVRMLPAGFDSEANHDVLIALHGHGSDRWQFAGDPRPEVQAVLDVAIERNMILILPDYRAKTSWMGPTAEADVVQIIEEVRTAYPVNRVFLCGGSMGASSALTFTALHPDLIAGVAAMNATANHLEYDQFQDAIEESFGGSKMEIPLEYKNRSAEYWPERFTMPVGITASGKDAIVPPHSVLRLADVLKKLGRPVLVIYREEDGHTSRLEAAREVLEFVIDTATQTSR
jgi:pimeloyl-ACP methyl ester carboxylesterase